ncbi:GntR family transcriptional regulator [Kitasatospora sp. MBT66]|uniref:GntR family transcriptional regulator n=1 Tax=Kitasatospora sp. MBT66 TaxID=1444769 RepID=UPI00068F5564|nr:GntR family transcriptional regulator [Kitasatospora sp. MBT66]
MNDSTADPPVRNAPDLIATLLAAISDGELRPGDQVPGNSALAERYGVHRNTASKAVSHLKAAGVLSGPAGGKTWVRVQPPHTRRSNMRYHTEKGLVHKSEEERAATGVAELDSGLKLENLYEDLADYDVIGPPADIASIFELSEGQQVLRRTRLRRHKAGAGSSGSVSYLPYDLVKRNPDLLDAKREPWPGGTMHQLFTVDVEVGRIRDIVTASMPTPEESVEYDIPPGVPVLRIRKISYSTEEQAVEIADIPIPADRVELIYDTMLEGWE